MIGRRQLMTWPAATMIADALPGAAAAADAPLGDRAARLLIGLPPGGVFDHVARLVAEQIRGYASSIVVENRPGAGGRIMLQALRAAKPDGSVMGLVPGDHLTLFPHVFRTLGYDPVADFAPVTTVCTAEFVLSVGPRVPAQVLTPADFVDWCRSHPELASYGTAGIGTRPHFLGAIFTKAAGVPLVHVPYKGGVEALQDLLAGQLAAMITTLSTALPHLEARKLRALATTASRRGSFLPEVPTFAEAGYPALTGVEWLGILLPAGAPGELVQRLDTAVRTALQTDRVKTGLARLAASIMVAAPTEFAQLIKADLNRWGEIVRESGFQPAD